MTRSISRRPDTTGRTVVVVDSEGVRLADRRRVHVREFGAEARQVVEIEHAAPGRRLIREVQIVRRREPRRGRNAVVQVEIDVPAQLAYSIV